MGVAGSDAALDTADVALMADDLSKLAYMVGLSRKTLIIIKQNIIFAILVKAVFVVLAFAEVWPTCGWRFFADVGASLLVTANGMRTDAENRQSRLAGPLAESEEFFNNNWFAGVDKVTESGAVIVANRRFTYLRFSIFPQYSWVFAVGKATGLMMINKGVCGEHN